MESILAKAERDVAAYRDDANMAWDEVKQAHDEAMAARDVEDVVAHGIYVMKSWFRLVEHWNEWVSGDRARYDADTHAKIEQLEQELIKITQGAVELIGAVKKWGFAIDGEGEFRGLADRLLADVTAETHTVMNDEIRALEQDALAQHKNSSLQEIDHWGE